MRLDHVSYAANRDGLKATAARLGDQLGIEPVDGGVHPRFGTRNMILPLREYRYIEVVEVLDHPASDKALFGQAVRQCSENGGGWLAWIVSVEDLDAVAARVGREPVAGNRYTPDGTALSWRQLGISGLMADPQVPYFIQWDEGSQGYPWSRVAPKERLAGLTIAGDTQRVREWLGIADNPEGEWEKDIDFEFVLPNGRPGLMAVDFELADGTRVRI